VSKKSVPSFTDHWFRGWYGPFPFTDEGVKMHAPSKSGVYQVRDRSGAVLYIGISTKSQLKAGEERGEWETEGSSSIQSRLKRHVTGRGNKTLAQLRTLGRLDGMTFVYHLCDGESARQIESFVTVNNKPSCNDKTERAMLPHSIMVH